jgi:hypothetical protein
MAKDKWKWPGSCYVSGVGQPTICEWVSVVEVVNGYCKVQLGTGVAAIRRSSLADLLSEGSTDQPGGGLRAAAKDFCRCEVREEL